MKKLLFIILLCFMVAFAAFAIDMSPHPGDTLETVFTVEDNVVISQVVSAPADMLYFEQINNYNEPCLSANDEMIESPYYLMDSDYNAVMAIVYIDFEMGTININTVDVAINCTEYG